MPVITHEESLALFDTAERSVMRLENRRHTDIESERAALGAFLAGEAPDDPTRRPSFWTEMLARHQAAGRPFRRVRIMDDPLTSYNRYMIYSGQSNVKAGEDIRYLARTAANALELPDHDFWVFDAERLTELRFTDDGRLIGWDLLVDPAIVARHQEWIERAFAAGTPSADYIAQDPTRAWPPIRVDATKGT